MTISWGTELWDQYDNLALHTQKGIDFLEKYGSFVKDRCAIEEEYAARLRKLVKSHFPKKKEEEDNQFTFFKAFQDLLKEVGDLAGQHEVIAEGLKGAIAKQIFTAAKEFKEERKRYLQDGARQHSILQTQISQLDRSKRNYEKAFREAEKALENYNKADADLNLSRADVEKHRMGSSLKSQQCEDAKNEYASQLQKTNELQYQHFHDVMPNIYNQLQAMDQNRIILIKNLMVESVAIEKKVFPIIDQCFDGILEAASTISEDEDSGRVVEKYKSGFIPPANIPFEDLSNPRGYHDKTMQPSSVAIMEHVETKKLTIKGTLSASRLRKRGGLFGIFGSNKNNNNTQLEWKEDFSELPPIQRKKRIQQRIDEINSKLNQEISTRDGLIKIKEAYEQNSAMGDPNSVEGQLCESGIRLDKLRGELQKYKSLLDQVSSTPVVTCLNPSNRTPNNGNVHLSNGGSQRNSLSEESLSRSASESSVSNPHSQHKLSAPSTPLPSHGPESGLGRSRTSLPDSEVDNFDVTGDNDEYFDAEVLPVLGTCKALYPFDAQSEGSIPLREGEDLNVIELDQGDGWTRVRRCDNTEEGFVPTSYIECYLVNSC